MKIVLLFPPMADYTQPYLGLPSLTAFLKQNGFDVMQKDLNIEALSYYLSNEELLKSYYREAYNKFIKLKNKTCLSEEEQKNCTELAELLTFSANMNSRDIARAKKILKDKSDFFDFKKYSWSGDIINECIRIVLFGKHPFTKRFVCGSLDELFNSIYKEKQENPFVEFFEEKALSLLASECPRLIGISINYVSQMVPGFTLARLIKEKLPNTHITIGGAIISSLSDIFEINGDVFSVIDSVVVGEGEYALLELAKKIKENSGFKSVPNLIYYRKGEIYKNKVISVCDLNALPTPCFDGFPMDLYLSPYPVIPLATSRGCYWHKCAFCNNCTRNNYYRERDAKLIVKDIRSLSQKYKTKYFFFHDNDISPLRLELLSSLFISNNLNIHWQCLSRLEKQFTKKICRLIAEAGCCNLSFGFESVCQRVLDLMEKGTNVKDFENILSNCRESKININLQFFIGFPSETHNEARKTLKFLLDKRDLIASVSFAGRFVLFRDSKVFDNPSKYGVKKIHHKNKRDLKVDYIYEVNSGMNIEELNMLTGVFYEELSKVYPPYLITLGPNFNAHALIYGSHYNLYNFLKASLSRDNRYNRHNKYNDDE